MSGHVGLREEARLGRLLARRIARLFPQAERSGERRTSLTRGAGSAR
jgi:hypothetical protein